MPEPRVLYISGWLRSGSTMLGNVLGELPGVLHAGELHYLWRNGVLEHGTNSLCGCGDRITECELWSRVLDGADAAEATEMERAQADWLRTRHTPARLGERSPARELQAAIGRTTAVYRKLAELGGERLIVDSSKFPAEAAALLGRDDVDVRILHIVRDPRATAFSYRRAKDYIDAMGAAKSSAYWTAFNAASEAIGRHAGDRYMRIRHEDLCREPRSAVAEVLRFVGLDDEPAVDDAGRVWLGENHTVTGNPDRLRRGQVTIKADRRWRTELPGRDAVAATLLALPFLARYGYRSTEPGPAQVVS